MGLERPPLHNLKRACMRGFEDNGGRTPGFVRLLPSRCTQAPPIAGLQPWKVVGRAGRAQVIALRFCERQKRLRHFRTNHVAASIFRPRGTIPRTVKSRLRIVTTRLQWLPHNTLGLSSIGR